MAPKKIVLALARSSAIQRGSFFGAETVRAGVRSSSCIQDLSRGWAGETEAV